MPTYSQTDRFFRVEAPALGEDVLLLESFSGEEHVSEPFEFMLQMLSETPDIDPTSVLREPLILTMVLPDGSERKIHGICNRFAQHGRDEDLTSYEAEIVPWLWFLSLNRDCKIFQQKTVVEIIEEVFSKYEQADFEFQCVESYQPLEYCVQYRESDLDFVSRLMEREGIFYLFHHSAEGHKLLLADDRSAVEACTGQDIFRVETTPDARDDEDIITALEREHQVYTTKVTITDYDFNQPSMNLESSASDDDFEEIYDYPGNYTQLSDGERYASLHLQAQACHQEIVRGTGRCRSFRSGFEFDLSEHYRADANQTYLLTSVWHSGHGGGYRAKGGEAEYSNKFECIPASIPFRPPHRTPKPIVQGVQTAVVVGPSGEEIFTEKNGQVRVQFHWDREGQLDENSSCWVRASHPWAGKGWGAVSIPRIGQEVIVDFLEGDPDRPIITGRVYNAEAMPPFPLPDSGVVSGIKSKTHKGSGYNEMSMNDTPGEEKFTVHAQYDESKTVGNDSTESVGNNRSSSVSVDDSLSVGSNQSVEVGSNQGITVGADRTVSVSGSETIEVSGSRSATITGADSVATSADHSVDASGAINLTSGAAMALNVGAGLDATASANIKIGAGGTIEISAPGGIKLIAGGTTIDMTPGSISINGAGMFDVVAGLIKHNG